MRRRPFKTCGPERNDIQADVLSDWKADKGSSVELSAAMARTNDKYQCKAISHFVAIAWQFEFDEVGAHGKMMARNRPALELPLARPRNIYRLAFLRDHHMPLPQANSYFMIRY